MTTRPSAPARLSCSPAAPEKRDMQLDELRVVLASINPRQKVAAAAKVLIEKDEAIATSPEGKTARMSVEALLAKAAAGQMNTGQLILPDGVKAVLSQGIFTLWIWESPPRLYNFDWIASDSPAPFGPGARYRKVRLALPYLVIVAVFGRGETGLPQLMSSNECFFRNHPLKDLKDELHYPALL